MSTSPACNRSVAAAEGCCWADTASVHAVAAITPMCRLRKSRPGTNITPPRKSRRRRTGWRVRRGGGNRAWSMRVTRVSQGLRPGAKPCGTLRLKPMSACTFRAHVLIGLVVFAAFATGGTAQTPQRGGPPAPPAAPTRADILRGEYSEFRANNDLLSYHLDLRVEPDKKFISGKNTITFGMLKDATRVQLDLYANLNVDKILYGTTPLKYERELNTVFVDFPSTLKAGKVIAIDFYYSGTPTSNGRFGGFTFGQDPAGRPWIYTACEGQGAAIWWPNKDQWRDEVADMEISVAIPNGLVDVSNGRF